MRVKLKRETDGIFLLYDENNLNQFTQRMLHVFNLKEKKKKYRTKLF